MKEKTYINQCKLVEKVFDNGGSVINAAFKIEELAQLANEGGWINITIAQRREPSDKGATHYAYLNEYEPKESKAESQKPQDGLPF